MRRRPLVAEVPIGFWVTIELYRTYLSEDGPLIEAVKANRGMTDIDTLAQITRSYAVSRTIPEPPGEDKRRNLQVFVAAINDLAKQWPDPTLERAKICREIAAKFKVDFAWKPDRLTPQHAPHSAVTKLIWFLRPRLWTVFDQVAANAVLRAGGSTCEHQQRFYDVIAEPLVDWANILRPTIECLDTNLHAERLIDKFLLFKGWTSEERGRAQTRNRYFLNLLPEEFGKRLEAVAHSVAGMLPDDAFPKEDGLRRRAASI